MTQQNHLFNELAGGEAGRRSARLGNVLDLVQQIAGGFGQTRDAALDDSARISSAYERSAPLVRRRFDAWVTEASAWAAAGLDALAGAADPGNRPQAAAARLADELELAMADLKKLLRA